MTWFERADGRWRQRLPGEVEHALSRMKKAVKGLTNTLVHTIFGVGGPIARGLMGAGAFEFSALGLCLLSPAPGFASPYRALSSGAHGSVAACRRPRRPAGRVR